MTKDTADGTHNTSVDAQEAMPSPEHQGAEDSISSAISHSRRLIEESYRLLRESRQKEPAKD